MIGLDFIYFSILSILLPDNYMFYLLQQKIKIEIENEHIALNSCSHNDESVKVELTCLYYLQLPVDEKAKGMCSFLFSQKKFSLNA